jgi:MFS transporter, putative metabolite:H+ symporter
VPVLVSAIVAAAPSAFNRCIEPACDVPPRSSARLSRLKALPLVYLILEHRAAFNINSAPGFEVGGYRGLAMANAEQLFPTDHARPSAGSVIARLDRLSVWSLPRLFIGIIGTGFLFTFYDIFDINVSFIQTCVAIVPNCEPETAAQHLGLPVLLNLVGYVIGTLMLSPLADRAGRRELLLVTMVISGVGSALTALVSNYSWFVVARTITGIGIGADLAIVSTYINEMAPRQERARYTSLIFFFSALGAVAGIWLGLWLTTPPTPLPLGLPFALAGPNFQYGWRIMYAIGGLLAVIGILLRFQLPESPRWLITRGRVEEADQVVRMMEAIAESRGPLRAVERAPAVSVAPAVLPYAAILRDPTYLRRTFLLTAMWFVSYITVYSFAAGFTTLLTALKYPLPEAGLITATGTLGFALCAAFAYVYGERLERKTWLPVAAIITLIGGVIVAEAGNVVWASVLGSIIVFFGFNLWVPIAYSWSAEHYPTRARTTGFALADGVGHLGGGVGMLLIAPLIPNLGVLASMLLICGFLVVGALIAQFGISTRSRALEEVSP